MKSERRAFTLIELVVVIGIIMVLVVILVAGLRRPRGQAHQAACQKNLREISAAALAYANQHNSYPKGWVSDQVRWMDLIKDHIDKGSKVYRCPADTQQLPVTEEGPDGMILSYGINRFNFAAGYSFWDGMKTYRVKRPSQTIIFADCEPGLYYCGEEGGAFLDPDAVPYVAYRHMDSSFCAAFCDGHAEALTATRQKQWDASQ